MKFWSPASWR